MGKRPVARYSKLDSAELLKGAQLAVGNAQALLAAADAAAEADQFGAAVALAVLATEEAMKGISLLGSVVDSDTSWLDRTLSHHRKKHTLGGLSATFVELTRVMIDTIEEVKAEVEAGELTNEHAGLEAFRRMIAILKRMKDEPTPDYVLWFRAADASKQAGLYVDHNGERWTSPADFTRETFDETRRFAGQSVGLAQICMQHPEAFLRTALEFLKAAKPATEPQST